jgi:hypothetical protein
LSAGTEHQASSSAGVNALTVFLLDVIENMHRDGVAQMGLSRSKVWSAAR